MFACSYIGYGTACAVSLPEWTLPDKDVQANCKHAVQIALSIKPGTVPTTLRKGLPDGVKAGKLQWIEDDQAVGNSVAISGSVRGIVVFGTTNPKGAELQTVSTVLLYLSHPGKVTHPRIGDDFNQCLEAINGSLKSRGKLTKLANDFPSVSGRVANWTIGGGRRITLYEHWYGNGVTLSMELPQRSAKYRLR